MVLYLGLRILLPASLYHSKSLANFLMDHNQIICNMETTTAVKSFEEKVQNVKDNYADIISLYLTDVQDSEERAKVIIELKRLNCCVRCICRFIHLREYKFYREKTEVIYFEFCFNYFIWRFRSTFYSSFKSPK